MTPEELMRCAHEKVLCYLLKLKEEKYCDLTFDFRRNNRNDRLKKGYWFQGDDDYIFIGIVDPGDKLNRTKQVGLVYRRINNTPQIYLEFIFRDPEIPQQSVDCYRSIIKELKERFGDILHIDANPANNQVKLFYRYDAGNLTVDDFIDFIDWFYENVWFIILKHYYVCGIYCDMLISQGEFEDLLSRINKERKVLYNSNAYEICCDEKKQHVNRLKTCFKKCF